MSNILWQPDEDLLTQSNLVHYMNWLAKEKAQSFASYDVLWEWSSTETAAFWESIWDYFEIISHSAYSAVKTDDPMPDTAWFVGSTLNYAEHVFRRSSASRPAIVSVLEGGERTAVSWEDLAGRVGAVRAALQAAGVGSGDRVCGFLPNTTEASVAFLATASLGAVWSSCSPDFGAKSVIDRFAQIAPKVLFGVHAYQYNGRTHDRSDVLGELESQLPSLERIVLLDREGVEEAARRLQKAMTWSSFCGTGSGPLEFEPVPFAHPLWILYSSGTTGAPKPITHGHGGMLLEHCKYLALHNDVRPGERFFWYTTTGWMMWNFVQAALLAGATIVLYDGSPAFPDLGRLWKLVETAGITHFGTSAPFVTACMKAGLRPGAEFDVSGLRSIGSTGAPLSPDGFSWIYSNVKNDVWLSSMSGGTDVCTAFVGGCPLEPVFEGEIQRRALGVSMFAFDESGKALTDEVGEMVITRPMPCMPVCFWNDPDGARYRESYFSDFPNVWRHGDWLTVTSRNTLIIHGRSDATLNRQGVRIGTAEVYRALERMSEIRDCLILNIEDQSTGDWMPLFVVLENAGDLDRSLVERIRSTLRTNCSPRHVPDEIIAVEAIPYTISGKKMETPVKKIFMGVPVEKAANAGAMRNPESLQIYSELARKRAARA